MTDSLIIFGSTLSVEYPWALLLLPLPWLVYRYAPAYQQPQSSIAVPFFQRLRDVSAKGDRVESIRTRLRWQKVLLSLLWLLLVLSLTRPVVLGAVIETPKYGRDLLVAIDLSQSMETKDYTLETGQKTTRFKALQQLMASFASTRQGDRLGLIVFGSGAYLQVPFTEDINLWQSLLAEMDSRMAGPATVIGDAIGLSIRVFEDSDDEPTFDKQKVLLLVTDGADTQSRLAPQEAAVVAASKGIEIYTLGMGDDSEADTAVEQQDKVDFESLAAIASVSGGQSFNASDRESLAAALQAINQLVPARFDVSKRQPKTDLYPWLIGPVAIAFLLLWCWLSLRESYNRRQSTWG